MLHVHVHRKLAFPRRLEVAFAKVAAKDAGGVDADPMSVLFVDFQENGILELLSAYSAESGFAVAIVNVFHVIGERGAVQHFPALITETRKVEDAGIRIIANHEFNSINFLYQFHR